MNTDLPYRIFVDDSITEPLTEPHTIPNNKLFIDVHDAHVDKLFINIYEYYIGGGLWTILLKNIINLCIVAYISMFSTFLLGCIDYTILFTTYDIKQAIHINAFAYVLIVMFSLYWLWYLIHFLSQIKSLIKTRDIYTQLLLIDEVDIETNKTVTWNDVVGKIKNLTNLDSYLIANIILREDNYLIGLFNQELLKLTSSLLTKQVLTTSMKWNIHTTIFNYFFDDCNRLKIRFLNKNNRTLYAQQLRKRFLISGILNLVLAPFALIFLIMNFIFKYGEEFYKNPGSSVVRDYTPLSKILMREYNEYPHIFEKRLKHSITKANIYVGQFPIEKQIIIASFISFISGSIAFILVILTVIDDDILLQLELTPGRSVLFYLGVFSTIFTIARSFISDGAVGDPSLLMNEIAADTHYLPDHWKENLHSRTVYTEFANMYNYRIIIFLLELFSVISTPYILCFTLANCSQDIVDFFCDYSINNIDHNNLTGINIGYICSFAGYGLPNTVVDIENNNNSHHSVKNRKMQQSFLYFKTDNPEFSDDVTRYP